MIALPGADWRDRGGGVGGRGGGGGLGALIMFVSHAASTVHTDRIEV